MSDVPLGDRERYVEALAALVHDEWMNTKRKQGVTSRPSESGEEQMVPYADLSEPVKDLDRGTVLAVLAAQDALGPLAALDPAGYVRGLADDEAVLFAVADAILWSNQRTAVYPPTKYALDAAHAAIRALAAALPTERTDRG